MSSRLCLLLFAILLLGIRIAEPPDHPRRFDKSRLTPAQLAACAAFKAKEGQFRQAEWDKIRPLFIVGPITPLDRPFSANDTPSVIITREDIVDLLGTPWYEYREQDGSPSDFFYSLDIEKSASHTAMFSLLHGHVVFALSCAITT